MTKGRHGRLVKKLTLELDYSKFKRFLFDVTGVNRLLTALIFTG